MGRFNLPNYGSELDALRDVSLIAKRLSMLYSAQTFLVIAIIADVLAFGEILGA